MFLNRRLVLRAGLVGAASPLVLNAAPARAEAVGSVFYTSEHPGRWAGKEGGHAPMIERSASNIEITTGHEMNGYVHYIVKHTLLDENLNYVDELMFDPEKDSPVSQHSVASLEGTVYALSMCNKHDVWITAFKL
ncbi:MAG TPA: desulfoferrodoxin family protein [Thermohalobaculum sp.]|nr:desulfoferrodoxin family protein [Thermohalobaculum sp.]